MDQKFILAKKETTLMIREVAETEPGIFSVLFEESLDIEKVEAAIAGGKNVLIDLFRSHNLYPPAVFSDMLARGITSMFGDDPKDSLRIEFNDIEALASSIAQAKELLEDEKELVEIDKLLEEEDDFDDEFEDS